MANIEALLNAIETGRQKLAAQKAKEEASRFNFTNAGLPAIAALAAAPFTGGTSLAALGAELAKGGVMEGVRAATSNNPQAQQIGTTLAGTVLDKTFPSEEKIRELAQEKNKNLLDIFSKNYEPYIPKTTITQTPKDIYGAGYGDTGNLSLGLGLQPGEQPGVSKFDLLSMATAPTEGNGQPLALPKIKPLPQGTITFPEPMEGVGKYIRPIKKEVSSFNPTNPAAKGYQWATDYKYDESLADWVPQYKQVKIPEPKEPKTKSIGSLSELGAELFSVAAQSLSTNKAPLATVIQAVQSEPSVSAQEKAVIIKTLRSPSLQEIIAGQMVGENR